MIKIKLLTIVFAFFFLEVVFAALPTNKEIFPNLSIKVNGKERFYRLVVPKTSQNKFPLLFAFHGLGDSKDLMPFYSKLDETAKKHGFILVYPNGIDKRWPLIPALAIDDIAFFDSLYEKLIKSYPIDENRVYLAGMSNGAYFINILAQKRAEKIAAIASHSGSIGFLGRQGLKTKDKYAVIIIHGDKDKIISVSEGRRTKNTYKSAGYITEYLEVKGLGHTWANEINVNDKIWQFFEANPKK
ncbi:MAG: PHB depolymerase family esterase [Blastocatellia bacterium]